MAKGNMIIGTGRGKVGNVVFSNLKGEQITKVYQPQVTNPRSYAQMYQRARFSNAVKFYKRAMSSFYEFAFEDKRKNESDFNAFMRHNVQYSIPLSRDRFNAIFYPALGNKFMMSSGSLGITALPMWDDDEGSFFIDLGGLPDNDTIGATSRVLKAHGAQDGDIVTIVFIRKDLDELAKVDEQGNFLDQQSPLWTVLQFIIDGNNQQPLSAIATKGAYTVADGLVLTPGVFTNEVTNESFSGLQFITRVGDITSPGSYDLEWCSVIITRKTAGKLLATQSFLEMSSDALDLVNALSTQDAVSAAVKSWQDGSSSIPTEVILKGGIANGLSDGVQVTGTAEQSDGSVSSVNGVSELPITGNIPGRGSMTGSIRVQGVNLDKVSFKFKDDGQGEVTGVKLNSLNTEAVVDYTLNQVISYTIIAVAGNNSVSLVDWVAPVVDSVNNKEVPANVDSPLGVTNTLVLKGSNLNEYNSSYYVVNGMFDKLHYAVKSDGSEARLTIRPKGAVGDKGFIYMNSELIANLTTTEYPSDAPENSSDESNQSSPAIDSPGASSSDAENSTETHKPSGSTDEGGLTI